MTKQSIAERARRNGIDPTIVYNRISKGWTEDRALNTPVRKRLYKKRKVRQTVAVKSVDVDTREANVDDATKHMLTTLEQMARDLDSSASKFNGAVVITIAAIVVALCASFLVRFL